MAEKPKEISESPLCINYLNEIPDHIEGMFSTYQKLSEDILLLNETIDLMDLRNDL